MPNNPEITVFFSSKTFGGGHKGREGLQPVCHSCDNALGLKTKNHKLADFVPAEAMPLIFSAELAAQQLGIEFELVDINRMSIIQKLRFKLQGTPILCVKIGGEFIHGIPTKDDIIKYYYVLINKT